VSFNSNFQNEFNQGQAAENSSKNHERNQIEILMKEISLGSKMVDKAGVFHLDTCFVSGSKITKLKNKNIKIYGNINISST
ncbi:TIGR04388 family protein, partial [Leptospira interrogans]